MQTIRILAVFSIAWCFCEGSSTGLRRFRKVLEVSDLSGSSLYTAASTTVEKDHPTPGQHAKGQNKHYDNRLDEVLLDIERGLKGAKRASTVSGKHSKKRGVEKKNRKREDNLETIIGNNEYGSLSFSIPMPSSRPPVQPTTYDPVATASPVTPPATTGEPTPSTDAVTYPPLTSPITYAPITTPLQTSAPTTYLPISNPVSAPTVSDPTPFAKSLAPTTFPPISDPGSTSPVSGTENTPTFTPDTVAPVVPATRGEEIMIKCGIAAETRTNDILAILSTLSEKQALETRGSPQYLARDWLDNIDEAIICPNNTDRVSQRYVAAALYYSMGGNEWFNCRAVVDGGECVNVQGNVTEKAPIRFLSPANECTWFGLGCGNNVSTSLSPDDSFDIKVIQLPDNNLRGPLATEIFSLQKLEVLTMDSNKRINGTLPAAIGDLTELKIIDLDDNDLSGTIPEELWQLSKMQVLDINTNNFVGTISTAIANLSSLNVLQLEVNQFTGSVPTSALLNLNALGKSFVHSFPCFTLLSALTVAPTYFPPLTVALTMNNNSLTGNVVPLCDVLAERRKAFETYLRFLFLDCTEVECTTGCCQC